MMEGQVLLMDSCGHLLVSLVAKQVLLGRKLVVACCEGINISGHQHFWKLLQKRVKVPRISLKTNENRLLSLGPYHF